MNTESNEPLVDWAQFAEIAGDLGDPSDAEQLAEIWHLLRGDIDQKWASLDHQTDAAEVRSSLHQIRGFVATWGLARVSPGGFSILVSQVTEPSGAVTQLVGTIRVAGPTLLPGPSR